MDHKFTDTVTLDGTRLTSDGYLTASVRVARTGVQYYSGVEIDPTNQHGLRDRARVGVYRPESEVFNKDSLASLAHRPVTIDHPPVVVDASNWKTYAVGQIGDEVARDGDFIRVPMTLMDSAAIDAVKGGKRELSAGYLCELEFADGVTAAGEDFSATQKNIKFNHLSVVSAARAGSQARIGDGSINWGTSPIHTTDTETKRMTMRTVLVDGLSVETTEAGAQAIAKLTADAARATADHAAAVAALDAKLATADAALAKAEAERDAAQAKVLSDADLDKAAAARGDLIAKAKALAPNVVTDGKPALDIKKAVLVDRKINLDGKSDAYIEARFDTLVEDNAGQDATREALGNIKPAVTTDAAKLEAEAFAKANDFNSWRDA